MNLQKKYFLIFFSLFVTLSLALSLVAYFLSNNILLNKYEELSADSLSYILEVTEKDLDQLSATFIFIANNPTVHERIVTDYSNVDNYSKLSDDEKVSEMFNAMNTFEIFSAINFIYIQGINGEEYWYRSGADFLDTDIILEGTNLEEIEIGRLDYQGYVSNKNPYSGSRNALRFTKALTDTLGKRTGLVYFELDADYFKTLYASDNIDIDTQLYLVDGAGTIIYHNDAYMIGRSFSTIETEGVVIDKVLARYGWHLISESPTEQIYAESGLIIRVTLIMALISIIIGMILILVITSRIVQPIKRLTKAMDDVRNGDLSVQVYHISRDEIGQLATNFNRMTERLKNNLEKEIAHNKAMNDAEYKALQAQINPHFMYNSLNALKWLAGIQKADNIIELVDALWTLLRKTSSSKGQFVTLKSELEVIDAYGTIQQVRYKGKFDISYNVDEAHKSTIIPKYILQPFVENAIFHGIEPKRGPGTIVVTTQIIGDDLSISVSDDGVGIDPNRIHRILVDEGEQQHGSGLNNIGVKNVNERLKLLYGESYGIIVDSTVGQGTTMTIRIPLDTLKEVADHV